MPIRVRLDLGPHGQYRRHIGQAFHRHELVATHPRLRKPGDRHTVRDHQPPEAQAWLEHDPQWCLARAKDIGPAWHAVILAMFNNTVLENLRGAQGIVHLREKVGDARLNAACERALAFSSPQYRTIKTILDKGLDSEAAAPSTTTAATDTYLNGGRFGHELLHDLQQLAAAQPFAADERTELVHNTYRINLSGESMRKRKKSLTTNPQSE